MEGCFFPVHRVYIRACVWLSA